MKITIDNIVESLKNDYKISIDNKITGSIELKINFFKGGITTIEKNLREINKNEPNN